MEIIKICYNIFWKNFVKSTHFNKVLGVVLISRNIFSVRGHTAHSVENTKIYFLSNIIFSLNWKTSWIYLIVGFLIWLSFLHSIYHPNLLVSLTNKFAAFWCNLLLWKGFAPLVFCWLYYSLLPKEDLKVWWWRCQVSINFEWIISSKSSFFFSPWGDLHFLVLEVW